ncbi:MAG: hypothetical protein WDO24_03530 [Pseudomonadota bacterium]
MRAERRDGGQDALQHDPDREIQHRPEAGGGERQRAEASDHHGVGEPHCHLREIAGGKRRGDLKVARSSDAMPDRGGRIVAGRIVAGRIVAGRIVAGRIVAGSSDRLCRSIPSGFLGRLPGLSRGLLCCRALRRCGQ